MTSGASAASTDKTRARAPWSIPPSRSLGLLLRHSRNQSLQMASLESLRDTGRAQRWSLLVACVLFLLAPLVHACELHSHAHEVVVTEAANAHSAAVLVDLTCADSQAAAEHCSGHGASAPGVGAMQSGLSRTSWRPAERPTPVIARSLTPAPDRLRVARASTPCTAAPPASCPPYLATLRIRL